MNNPNTGPDRRSIEELAKVFKAMSDPTRLSIVQLLAKSPGLLCVNALTRILSVTQSAVSQHLRVLRNVGLVRSKRVGPMVHYRINEDALEEYRDLFAATFGKDILTK